MIDNRLRGSLPVDIDSLTPEADVLKTRVSRTIAEGTGTNGKRQVSVVMQRVGEK